MQKFLNESKSKVEEIELLELSSPTPWFKILKSPQTPEELEKFKRSVKEAHDTPEYAEEFNLFIERLKHFDPKEARKMSLIVHACELEVHGKKNLTYSCLKSKIDAGLPKILLDKAYPGFPSNKLPDTANNWMKTNSDKLDKMTSLRLFRRYVALAVQNMDFTKDFLLFNTMVSLVGIAAVFNPALFTQFQIQIIWIWCMSIFLPLLISTWTLALQDPLAMYGQKVDSRQGKLSKWKKIWFSILSMVIFPLVPAMLLYTAQVEEEMQERVVQEIHDLIMQNMGTEKAMEKYRKTKTFLSKIKKYLLDIKSREVLETSAQLILQTVMLAMYHSTTTTTGGLETVFGNDTSVQWISTQVLIVLSVLWSFKTSITTRLKQKKSACGFLPFTGVIVIAARTLLTTGVNVATVLAFFTPSLGLFSLLQHLQTEQLLPMPPGSDKYVGDLQMAYIYLLLLLCLNLLLIICCKIARSDKFIQASPAEMIAHALDNFCLPDAYSDWSEGNGNISDYKERRKNHCIESVIVSFLQWVMHMVMFLPLWNTGKQPAIMISKPSS